MYEKSQQNSTEDTMKRITKVSGAALLALGLVSTATAGTIDLTKAGAVSTASTGVIFAETDIQPTGTGVIDPFLRLQNTPTEIGVNTSLDTPNQPIMDDKPGLWTHDLAIGSLGTVTRGGTTYYKFLLDINQTTPGQLLNLNTIQLYVFSSAFTTVGSLGAQFNFSGKTGASGGTPKSTGLALDALGAGNSVLLNYSLNHGSGSGDMFMYVPTSALPSSGFLYLYNANGVPNGSNDGFEEWASQLGPGVVPVPDASTTLMLLGMAFVGVEGLRRKLSV
jgi:hypothetical protein